MKGFKYGLLFSFLVLGCQNANNQEKNQIVTFDIKELSKITSIKLSDLGFVDIVYIPLETNENSIIQRVNEINVGNEFFLIKYLDRILKFKFNGSFVTKIGTEGRGPNEFIGAIDLDIDKINQNIYLVSGSQKKFYVYTENGEFIKSFQSPLNTTDFRFVEGGILCYSMNLGGNIDFSYNLIGNDGKIIDKIPNKYPYKDRFRKYIIQKENLFYRFKDRLYKKEVYSDTIFVLENINFKPHLVIEQGKRVITTKARSESDPEYLLKNFSTPLDLFEFGDYIYYRFLIYPESYCFIGSKKNDFQALVNPEQGFTNDLDGGPNILPMTIKDDNTIIGWVDAIKLKNYVASEAFKNSKPKYPEKKKELEKLANSMKETDNPVLMLVQLKK